MSYSYVKTVFPDFKYSNVYDTKLYDNLSISNQKNVFEPVESQNYYNINSKDEEGGFENYPLKNTFQNLETFQNNQKIYHPPMPIPIPLENNTVKEEFDNKNSIDHSLYTTHVLDCKVCKDLLMKQFGIENQRLLNTDIMELISYILFGLFIILLIDSYAK